MVKIMHCMQLEIGYENLSTMYMEMLPSSVYASARLH